MNENYKASKEDLKYFNSSFENILFDKSFFEIFDLKKLKIYFRNFLNFGFVILRGFIILSYSFSFIKPALITSCFKVVPFL